MENNQNQLQKSQVVFMCVPPAERERPLRGLKRRDFGGWESHQAIGEAIALRCHVICFQIAWKRAWKRTFLGGGFKYFVFSSLFGEDSNFDSYCSNGLKPPTRRTFAWLFDVHMG